LSGSVVALSGDSDQSASFYMGEAKKCRQAAGSCREVIKCYKAGDTDSVACKEVATVEIEYLKNERIAQKRP